MYFCNRLPKERNLDFARIKSFKNAKNTFVKVKDQF